MSYTTKKHIDTVFLAENTVSTQIQPHKSLYIKRCVSLAIRVHTFLTA